LLRASLLDANIEKTEALIILKVTALTHLTGASRLPSSHRAGSIINEAQDYTAVIESTRNDKIGAYCDDKSSKPIGRCVIT
jgi:hypothetical protein